MLVFGDTEGASAICTHNLRPKYLYLERTKMDRRCHYPVVSPKGWLLCKNRTYTLLLPKQVHRLKLQMTEQHRQC